MSIASLIEEAINRSTNGIVSVVLDGMLETLEHDTWCVARKSEQGGIELARATVPGKVTWHVLQQQVLEKHVTKLIANNGEEYFNPAGGGQYVVQSHMLDARETYKKCFARNGAVYYRPAA